MPTKRTHQKPVLSHNAFANAVQVVLSVGLLFMLYRAINVNLGVEKLGVWAVVLATASFSKLADFGISLSVTKFVAGALSKGERRKTFEIIDTSVLTVAAIVGALTPFLYFGLWLFLPRLIDGEHLKDAQEILPYALVSLWFSAISTVQLGGLDGHQRMIARACLESTGVAIYVLLAILMLKPLQLVGLAYAQIFQAVFMLVGGRFLLRQSERTLTFFPTNWNWEVLRKMLGYSFHLQLSALAASLLNPLTKIILTMFGGVSVTGYFEMASQVVERSRSILTAANRSVVPKIAQLYEKNSIHEIRRIYRKNMAAIQLLIVAGCTILFSSSHLISFALMGEVDKQFVLLLIICTISWGLNSLSIPAYFFNLGSGHVGINSFSMGTMALINLPLGFAFGKFFGGIGPVIAYGVSISFGAAMLVLLSSKNLIGTGKTKWSIKNLPIHLACVTALLSAFRNLEPINQVPLWSLVVWGVLVPTLAVLLLMWIHPIRKATFSLREPR